MMTAAPSLASSASPKRGRPRAQIALTGQYVSWRYPDRDDGWYFGEILQSAVNEVLIRLDSNPGCTVLVDRRLFARPDAGATFGTREVVRPIHIDRINDWIGGAITLSGGTR